MSVIDYVFGVTRIRFSLPGYAAGRYFLVLLLMAAIGLSPLLAQANDTIYTDDTGPDVPLYKTANEDFTRNIPLRTDPAEVEKSWEQKDFYVIETDLSPARLIHNQTDEITFFNDLSRWGLAGPSHFAFASQSGIKIVKGRKTVSPPAMSEAWVLAWFSGTDGWTNWDVPWLIMLQNKPESITNGAEGLTFNFADKCGYVAAMPLYGYYKPPVRGKDMLKKAGLPSKNIRTWQWSEKLGQDVIERCRFWTAATRYFPTYVHETFSVDTTKDRLTLKEDFDWITIEDAWGTTPVKFAVLPPTLGIAWLYKTFPMTVSGQVYDPWYFTSYGPYLGLRNTDSYTIDLNVLQYLHETEAQQSPDMSNPHVAAAVEKLNRAMDAKFPKSDGSYTWDHGKGNFVWASLSDCWYPKVLNYMDPQTRSNALKSLRNYFDQGYLQPERYHLDKGYPHPYYVAYGPGCWDGKYVKTDSGKLATARLYTMWCYGHYTGDWDLLQDRWDIVRWSHSTEQTMTWKTVGRGSIAELGDEAPPSMALARIAYRLGKTDTYLYGAYMFARELVHHYVKQVGGDYFRRNQPYHSMEIIPELVFPTNIWGDTAGWQLDGPNFPEKTGERQYTNRYVRFHSQDVARFHRDTLAEWIEPELDFYEQIKWLYKPGQDTAHIRPSLLRLKSFLENAEPQELCQTASPDQWQGHAAGCGTAALAYSVIRTARPMKFERLVPAGKKYPFITGLERDIGQPWGGGTIDRNVEVSKTEWPAPSWMLWPSPKKPKGQQNNRRFSFGCIRPTLSGLPRTVSRKPWNWVTSVTSYDLPE